MCVIFLSAFSLLSHQTKPRGASLSFGLIIHIKTNTVFIKVPYTTFVPTILRESTSEQDTPQSLHVIPELPAWFNVKLVLDVRPTWR